MAFVLAIGFVVSFATAVLGIKFLLSYIQKRSFIGFGVYRIVLAVVFFLLVV
jgi:undecaprenyl-diphosphatase